MFEEKGVEQVEDKGEDMLAGVKGDLVRIPGFSTGLINLGRWPSVQKTIRETFALNEVPREALYIGLAGVVPYMVTSLSTVYLAFDINHASEVGSGYLFSSQTAELLLHVIEPIQIGYGAVVSTPLLLLRWCNHWNSQILSFLGAIHWGLEWAKYGGAQGYRRYAIGVVCPAVAWPTLFFPIEYALISQFIAFTFLYYADARTVVRGWTPEWYSTYRFVLTFIVGASIVASLIGRGEIADKIHRLPGPADRIKALRDSQMEYLSEEEKVTKAKLIAGEDDEDEEEEDEEEDGDDWRVDAPICWPGEGLGCTDFWKGSLFRKQQGFEVWPINRLTERFVH